MDCHLIIFEKDFDCGPPMLCGIELIELTDTILSKYEYLLYVGHGGCNESI